MTDHREALEAARKAAAAEFSARGAWREPDRDDLNAAIFAYEASLEAAGYVRVPREPTEAMMVASRSVEPSTNWRDNIKRAWSAMIAASAGKE